MKEIWIGERGGGGGLERSRGIGIAKKEGHLG